MKKIADILFSYTKNFARTQKNIVIGLSVIIGILSGLAAVILKHTVHYVEIFVVGLSKDDTQNYLYLILPFVGILLTWLFIKSFIKDDIGHGVSKILQSISRKNGKIKNILFHFFLFCNLILLKI